MRFGSFCVGIAIAYVLHAHLSTPQPLPMIDNQIIQVLEKEFNTTNYYFGLLTCYGDITYIRLTLLYIDLVELLNLFFCS